MLSLLLFGSFLPPLRLGRLGRGHNRSEQITVQQLLLGTAALLLTTHDATGSGRMTRPRSPFPFI